MIATLNDLEVKVSNILNAYVQAPVLEKVWTTLCLEFDRDARKTAVIIRALYGLKSAWAALEVTLLSAWSHWSTSIVRLTWIYGLNQNSDHKINYSIAHIYFVMWMIFFVSIIMQMPL